MSGTSCPRTLPRDSCPKAGCRSSACADCPADASASQNRAILYMVSLLAHVGPWMILWLAARPDDGCFAGSVGATVGGRGDPIAATRRT